MTPSHLRWSSLEEDTCPLTSQGPTCVLDVPRWSTGLGYLAPRTPFHYSLQCLLCCSLSQGFTNLTKQESEVTSYMTLQSENRDLTGSRARLYNIEAQPQRLTSSGKAPPLKNSKPEPPAGTQVSKHVSL